MAPFTLQSRGGLEKALATHSSILAWEILWTEKPGLQSMGSQRVGHDLATKLPPAAKVVEDFCMVASSQSSGSVLFRDREEDVCQKAPSGGPAGA